MQKFKVRSRSNFFSNFGDFTGSFNPVFHFHFKNINFFEIGPKLTLISNIFQWNYFFGGGIPLECEEIERTFPSSFRLVPHNVNGIPPTLWPTLWPECLRECEPKYRNLLSLFSFDLSWLDRQDHWAWESLRQKISKKENC